MSSGEPPVDPPVDLVITPGESLVLQELRDARDRFNELEPAATVEETVDFLAGLKQAQGVVAVRALKRRLSTAFVCVLFLLSACSAALGQLAAPLDSAAILYRAQAYDGNNTVIPNEGTRTEPWVLGPTLGTDIEDPVFVSDQTIGDHWRFPLGNSSHGVANVPASVLNGNATFAIRQRPEQLWADRLLLSVIDPTLPYGTKHYMLHQTSSGRYMSRFWEAPPGWSQIGVTSTTTVSQSRTDTIISSWNLTTKQTKLYVNGVLEGTYGTGNPRSSAVSSGLQVPLPYTILYPSCKVFSIASWTYTFTDQNAIDLQNCADWYVGGGDPVPPPMGLLRVFVNGTEQPQGTTVKIDGVPVEPPTGETDKIVEVETL